jgi:hypothetical protein
VQQPRIPVWTACIVPHTAPLRRAARWDGVALGSMGESGSIERVTVDEVRAAVDVVAELREPAAGPFDVAISSPDIPSDDELDDYAAAGATWVVVSRWVDELPDLIGLIGDG